jgi:hypothetical protein
LRVSGPSIPGIMTSNNTRSGAKATALTKASLPEDQGSTVNPLMESNTIKAIAWISGSSSTYKMRSSGLVII